MAAHISEKPSGTQKPSTSSLRLKKPSTLQKDHEALKYNQRAVGLMGLRFHATLKDKVGVSYPATLGRGVFQML